MLVLRFASQALFAAGHSAHDCVNVNLWNAEICPYQMPAEDLRRNKRLIIRLDIFNTKFSPMESLEQKNFLVQRQVRVSNHTFRSSDKVICAAVRFADRRSPDKIVFVMVMQKEIVSVPDNYSIVRKQVLINFRFPGIALHGSYLHIFPKLAVASYVRV